MKFLLKTQSSRITTSYLSHVSESRDSIPRREKEADHHIDNLMLQVLKKMMNNAQNEYWQNERQGENHHER